MSRRVTWWLLVGLLVVFDVVTVVFRLLEPAAQAVLLVASAMLLGGWGVLRWLDARMHRAHSRAAFASLAWPRERRAQGSAVNEA
ncbi:MAG TPA: hypothetical protein VGC13_26075 [Longimicrobium sp.]|jgi:hypothetical protein|uniref:hypothetical protein n=1 Tax=Longimicrobium sp. TaxID=2029185 RepID=UPI002ED9DED7